jgi:hypothetical protein
MFGQRRTGTLAPGLGFAFGAVRRSFIDEADERGWLVSIGRLMATFPLFVVSDYWMKARLDFWQGKLAVARGICTQSSAPRKS